MWIFDSSQLIKLRAYWFPFLVLAHDNLLAWEFVHQDLQIYQSIFLKAIIIEEKTCILEKLLRPCAPRVFYRTTSSSPLSACLLQWRLPQHLQQSERLIVWSQSWIKYLHTTKFTRKPEIKMIGNLLFQKKSGLNWLQRFSLLYGSCYMKYTNQSCPYSNRPLHSITVFLLPWRLGNSWPDFFLKSYMVRIWS